MVCAWSGVAGSYLFFMFLAVGIQKEIFNASLILDLLKLPLFGFYSDMSSLVATRDFICKLFEHPVVHVVRVAMHSLFVWIVVFSLISPRSGLKLSPLKAFLWGSLGHVLTNLLTHVEDASPLFWPASDIVIRGPLSYWHPNYNGREFSATIAF
jgi:hypothetical protein